MGLRKYFKKGYKLEWKDDVTLFTRLLIMVILLSPIFILILVCI